VSITDTAVAFLPKGQRLATWSPLSTIEEKEEANTVAAGGTQLPTTGEELAKEIDKICNNSALKTELQKQRLRELLQKRKRTMCRTLDDVGQAKVAVPHDIVLEPDARPSRSAPHRLAPTENELVNTHLKQTLDAKVIEPTNSPWLIDLFVYTAASEKTGFR
jgi:hypothetical protein